MMSRHSLSQKKNSYYIVIITLIFSFWYVYKYIILNEGIDLQQKEIIPESTISGKASNHAASPLYFFAPSLHFLFSQHTQHARTYS